MKKTVLITGASSGFGKACAKLFQNQGWNVIAAMRSPEKEEELKDSENLLLVKLDVTDLESIKKSVEQGLEKFSTIDVLINSAGYGLIGVFESSDETQIQKQFEVNVFGLMNMTKAILPAMRKQKSGVIVNISSFGGVTASPFTSLYNSSKFAVEGFSEALYFELSSFGISVKIVEPGSVATNFRNGMEMIQNTIEDYNQELASFIPKFTKRTEHVANATTEEVANTIFEAATDDQSRLRYSIGEDAKFYIDLKNQNSEEDFLRFMQE
ncbi:SDR family oxidoreductase [Pedobacter antarcticus]|uniref:SDR family oxidoreductase n=1 Tax=Pedobacter antarcticus TaxID=34086 RepID=UPI000885B524|nr:SDR family oxidoreductase [Pedobacter antarcticus]SDM31279.1 NADP-dependent 3-hydroxy acid dehydrogenase YdfG [Pedobacter antarcticus]